MTMRSYDREALRGLLASRSFKRDEVNGFRLASGVRSRVYFNLKTTMLHPQGAAECALGLLAVLDGLEADYVAGLEMGAVPLLSVVAALSADGPRPVSAVFVRKKPKDHGTALMIEGLDELGGDTLVGKRVVLIDDVATSGGSMLQAADQIRGAGGDVRDAIVIVDREQGAAARLAESGLAFHRLFTAADLGVTEQDLVPLD
jgi:orotate phosphoribosyltransferase